jgi:membrane protein implicated in regulation of membrane protease activity
MVRIVVLFVLMFLLGIAGAFFASWLVGLIWPRARLTVFVVVSVWWLWTGWKYAKARDEGRF